MGDPLKVIIQDEPHSECFARDDVREAEATFAVGQRDRRLEPLKIMMQDEPHAEGFQWEEVREAEATFAVGQRDRRIEPLKVIVQDEPHGKCFERDEVREAEATFAAGQCDRRLDGKGFKRDGVREAEADTFLKEHSWLLSATEMHPWLFPEGLPAPASASKQNVRHVTLPKDAGRHVRGASRNTFYDFYFDECRPCQPQRSSSAPVTSIGRSLGTIRCNFGFGCTPCEYMPRDSKKDNQGCQLPARRSSFCKRDDEGNVVDLPKICRNGVQCRHCHCHPKKNFERLKSRARRWARLREQAG